MDPSNTVKRHSFKMALWLAKPDMISAQSQKADADS